MTMRLGINYEKSPLQLSVIEKELREGIKSINFIVGKIQSKISILHYISAYMMDDKRNFVS